MSATSLSTLELLLDRAQQERDRLAGQLQRAEELAERARRQAEQLIEYRSEYTQRWNRQFGAERSAIGIVQCYHGFMQRLDEACTSQADQQSGAERELAMRRAALIEGERRVASVRKLIERRRAELRHAEERRDQRATDEQAQSVVRRRRASPTSPTSH